MWYVICLVWILSLRMMRFTHVSYAECYPIIWIYHNLFIHLLMNIQAAPNIRLLQMKMLWTFVFKYLCEHVLSWLLHKYLGVEWLDYKVGVCIILPNSSPTWLCCFPFIPGVYESSNCSTTLPTQDVDRLFNYSNSSGSIAVSQCGFNLHDDEHLFICLLAIHKSWMKSLLNLLTISIGVLIFLWSIGHFLCILGRSTLLDMWLQIFSPVLSSCSFNSIFWRAVLTFD